MNPAYSPCPFPVGYIVHMTNRATNPSTLWPGTTWQEINDRFLLGASAAYPAGTTGGKATHTLTLAEMPMHSHTVMIGKTGTSQYWGPPSIAQMDEASHTGTGWQGGSQPHNNMPPYKAVYIWERTG